MVVFSVAYLAMSLGGGVVESDCNVTYIVQNSSNLNNWVDIDTFDGTGSKHTYPFSENNNVGFYRAILFSQINDFIIGENYLDNPIQSARLIGGNLSCSPFSFITTEQTFSGFFKSFGSFRGGFNIGMGVENGVVMSTGRATDILQPNTNLYLSTDWGYEGSSNIVNSFDMSNYSGNFYMRNGTLIEFTFQLGFEDPSEKDLFIIEIDDIEVLRISPNTLENFEEADPSIGFNYVSDRVNFQQLIKNGGQLYQKHSITFKMMDIDNGEVDTGVFIRRVKVNIEP